jgi:hypothetical protein
MFKHFKNFLSFSRLKSVSRKETDRVIPDESIIFNVDNFNDWFCDPNNGAVYANKGIFLRVDKLSESQIIDYIEKKWGIKKDETFLWSKPFNIMVSNFHKEIRKDWVNKLENG